MNPYSPKMVPGQKNPDQLVPFVRNQAKSDPVLSALLLARLHWYTCTHTLSLFFMSFYYTRFLEKTGENTHRLYLRSYSSAQCVVRASQNPHWLGAFLRITFFKPIGQTCVGHCETWFFNKSHKLYPWDHFAKISLPALQFLFSKDDFSKVAQ